MSGFGILMLIFGGVLLLVGFYTSRGHKLSIFDYRPAFKNATIDDWKKIGKYTMIVSIFILLLGVVAIIFNFE